MKTMCDGFISQLFSAWGKVRSMRETVLCSVYCMYCLYCFVFNIVTRFCYNTLLSSRTNVGLCYSKVQLELQHVHVNRLLEAQKQGHFLLTFSNLKCGHNLHLASKFTKSNGVSCDAEGLPDSHCLVLCGSWMKRRDVSTNWTELRPTQHQQRVIKTIHH